MKIMISLRCLTILCLISINRVAYCFMGRWTRRGSNGMQLGAQKFEPAEMVTVTVRKPLGVGLVENIEGQKFGVSIDEIDEGSVKASGLVRKGMYLLTINNRDVRYEDFDTILDFLVDLPEADAITLQLIDMQRVMQGPAAVNVLDNLGNPLRSISSVKGMNLRSVLLASGVDVYDMRGKVTNCGGGGSCGTCGVEIMDNPHWTPRADFEARRLRQYSPQARLSCCTTIEGDCTVVVKPLKRSV